MAGAGVFQDVMPIVSAEDSAKPCRHGRVGKGLGVGTELPGCSASGVAAIIWALHLAGMCLEAEGNGHQRCCDSDP